VGSEGEPCSFRRVRAGLGNIDVGGGDRAVSALTVGGGGCGYAMRRFWPVCLLMGCADRVIDSTPVGDGDGGSSEVAYPEGDVSDAAGAGCADFRWLPLGAEIADLSGDGRTVVGRIRGQEWPDVRAFVWREDDLQILSEGTYSVGVSDDGDTVVGGIVTGDRSDDIFLWSRSSGARTILTSAEAVGISADGTTVVGNADYPDVYNGYTVAALHAFVWDAAQGTRWLPTWQENPNAYPDGEAEPYSRVWSAAAMSSDATSVAGAIIPRYHYRGSCHSVVLWHGGAALSQPFNGYPSDMDGRASAILARCYDGVAASASFIWNVAGGRTNCARPSWLRDGQAPLRRPGRRRRPRLPLLLDVVDDLESRRFDRSRGDGDLAGRGRRQSGLGGPDGRVYRYGTTSSECVLVRQSDLRRQQDDHWLCPHLPRVGRMARTARDRRMLDCVQRRPVGPTTRAPPRAKCFRHGLGTDVGDSSSSMTSSVSRTSTRAQARPRGPRATSPLPRDSAQTVNVPGETSWNCMTSGR